MFETKPIKSQKSDLSRINRALGAAIDSIDGAVKACGYTDGAVPQAVSLMIDTMGDLIADLGRLYKALDASHKQLEKLATSSTEIAVE